MKTEQPIHLSTAEVKGMEKIKGLNLINHLTGYKSANLIGTRSADAYSNVSIESSAVQLSLNPSQIGFIQRPTAISRHTYSNIPEMSVFTFNQVHEGISAKAHYTSAKLEKNESEFEHCRLREKNLDGFGAPFVFESHVKLAVRHVNTYHQVDQLASYTYARPGIFPTNLVQPSEIHIKSSHT